MNEYTDLTDLSREVILHRAKDCYENDKREIKRTGKR